MSDITLHFKHNGELIHLEITDICPPYQKGQNLTIVKNEKITDYSIKYITHHIEQKYKDKFETIMVIELEPIQ